MALILSSSKLCRLAEKHKFKGNAAYKVGSYTEACDHYTKAIYHNPNSATYWSNRSAALMMLQDYTAALEDCTQAIKLDDSFTKVMFLVLRFSGFGCSLLVTGLLESSQVLLDDRQSLPVH